MSFTVTAMLYSAALLMGMLICMEAGRRLGVRRVAMDREWALSGLSVVETAVFGLYGLLLAFTFSGAPARLDVRKQLVADEANAIFTAWLRLDLLPAGSRPGMRRLFRQYLDSRLEVYEEPTDIEAAKKTLAKSSTLQDNIWVEAVACTRLPGAHEDAAKLLLPALNQMIDITTTRTNATLIHTPLVIYVLMLFLALVCSLLAGYSMARDKHRSWLHIAAFATVTAISVYAFLEIEYPRVGLLRLLGASDQLMIALRERMQ
jgi:hypothetical protein